MNDPLGVGDRMGLQGAGGNNCGYTGSCDNHSTIIADTGYLNAPCPDGKARFHDGNCNPYASVDDDTTVYVYGNVGCEGFLCESSFLSYNSQSDPALPSSAPAAGSPSYGLFAPNTAPAQNSTCQAKLLGMANQELGTNFSGANVTGSYYNGNAYNIIIQSSQLTPTQFNNTQQGRYPTYGMQWMFGAGLAGHVADETNLGFPQSTFLRSNVGGNLSVQFAFHDDSGFAYNPFGALIHWITDVLGHNRRQPCRGG